jgi:uncharacterized membrane protein YeaQ/YmgE (transglycosylase-associated protein family)
MFNFLWWFVAGPIVGWLAGRLMRSGHNGWMDALSGLVGATLAGTLCEFAGFAVNYTWVESVLTGSAGALVVTFIFRKVIAGKTESLPRQASTRSSYTSYKSRMGK